MSLLVTDGGHQICLSPRNIAKTIVAWLLTIKQMYAGLTSFCVIWGDWHQLLPMLLHGSWWVGPCVASPLIVVVGRSASILAYVLRPVVLLSGLPLVAPHVLSVGVGVVMIVAVVVPTIVVIVIVVIVATIVIILAIVVPSAIVVIPPIVLIAIVVFFPVAVVA